MKKITILIVLVLFWSIPVTAEPPTRLEIEKMMGNPSQGDQIRGQLDTVGYVVTPEQANDRMKAVLPAARTSSDVNTGIIGGICPHDDHLLQYGTSISEPEPVLLPETRSQGLGYTAASNLHHWVGFFSLAVSE